MARLCRRYMKTPLFYFVIGCLIGYIYTNWNYTDYQLSKRLIRKERSEIVKDDDGRVKIVPVPKNDQKQENDGGKKLDPPNAQPLAQPLTSLPKPVPAPANNNSPASGPDPAPDKPAIQSPTVAPTPGPVDEAPGPDAPMPPNVPNGLSLQSEKTFIFIAIPKTGSETTRSQLRRWCLDRKKDCLGWAEACQGARAYWNCAGNTADLTMGNVKKCCTVPNKTPPYDALIDHFLAPPKQPDSAVFLDTFFPKDSIRFTFVRDPIQHAVSEMKFVCKPPAFSRGKPPYCDYKIEDLTKMLFSNRSLVPNPGMGGFLNYQAKYIGFKGSEESLEKVLSWVKTLDFVGIYEEFATSWCIIRNMLNWPKGFFVEDAVRKPHLYDLNDETMKKLDALNWADKRLYNIGYSMFSAQKEKYKSVCGG